MAQYRFEIGHRASGKCPTCGKQLDGLSFGSAALYSAEDDDVYGTVIWRHVACAEKRQVQWLGSNLSKIKGWDQLPNDDVDIATSAFEEIRNSEKKAKKKAPSKPSKARTSKKRKVSDDEDKPKKKAKKDKNAPKPARTAYILYSVEMRSTYKQEHPNEKPTEIMRGLSTMWKSLTDEEKEPYKLKQKQDKERYERQTKEYEETGKFTPEAEEEDSSQKETEDSSKQETKKKGRLRKIAEDDSEENEQKAEESTEAEQTEEEPKLPVKENGKEDDEEPKDEEGNEAGKEEEAAKEDEAAKEEE